MEIIGSNFDPPFENPAWVHGCRLKRQNCRKAGHRSRLIWTSAYVHPLTTYAKSLTLI
jgi:hypothetical protein